MNGDINLVHLIAIFSISFFILAILLFSTLNHIYKQNIVKEMSIRTAIYTTQEEERSRISVELHDNIGTKLSALKLFTESLRNGGNNQSTIDEIIVATKEAISELRAIIINTSGDHIIRNGLKSELEILISRISKTAIEFKMDIPQDFPEFRNLIGVNIYRILQELINNSFKHSGCSIITIVFELNNEVLQIVYSDNGIGFDINLIEKKGMGLKNIAARISIFNGRYKSLGTTFQIEFPINNSLLTNEVEN
jgi:signal transduction histidine kinase